MATSFVPTFAPVVPPPLLQMQHTRGDCRDMMNPQTKQCSEHGYEKCATVVTKASDHQAVTSVPAPCFCSRRASVHRLDMSWFHLFSNSASCVVRFRTCVATTREKRYTETHLQKKLCAGFVAEHSQNRRFPGSGAANTPTPTHSRAQARTQRCTSL